MRFAFLSSCPEPWGGSEELWFQAALALRDQGHEIDVLKTYVIDADGPIRRLRDRGCTVRDIDALVPGRVAFAASAVLPEALALHRRRTQALAAAARLAARPPELAIVSQGENSDGVHLAMVCAWLGVPYALVSQKASEVRWPSDHVRPHLGRVLAEARRSVFVSEHNLKLTEMQVAATIPRAEVLPNPVLAGLDGPLPWPSEAGAPLRLACVGRMLVSQKGQDLLLEVLAGARWRERPLHVSFFGRGSNDDGLRGMARLLGVGAVSFEGHIDRIEDVWRTHHALALPSRMEGLPLSVLEAMACGRVSIVTDVGGNAELVEDSVTGFVAAAPTVESVGDALERAWQARDRWPAMGAAAARRVARHAPVDAFPRLASIALEEGARAGPPRRVAMLAHAARGGRG